MPKSLTSFVGREREVAKLVDELERDDVRLITLTGPGGVGKTRLAVAVASAVAAKLANGVQFVPLAPLADYQLVAPVIARTLGVPETGEHRVLARLQTWLRDKEILLLLDNFEHVLGAAPLVPALLTTCPGLTMMVTSRALLRVSGERSFPVPPLPNPAAVELFAERASAIHADLVGAVAHAEGVSEVCQRLDRLPLAIELAAGLAHVLTPRAMLVQLERRRMPLALGMRDQPARQQTMHNTIAWSYDLLDTEEQTVFRCLAVFAGGFSLDLAQTVATGADLSQVDVLNAVASLCSQSLLVRSSVSGSQPRFEMLQTFREFGLEQLHALGEERNVRQSHALAILAFVERLLPGGIVAVPDGHLAQVQLDVDNVRAALSWFDETGDHDSCLRLARWLFVFWWLGGHLREGRGWLERSLDRAEESNPMRREAYCVLGLLQRALGDDEVAARSLETAMAMEQSGEDDWIEPLALRTLSEVASWRGQFEEAKRLATESLSIFKDIDPTQVPETLRQLAIAVYELGDIDRASKLCEEALKLARGTNDTQFIECALDTLSLIACSRGDHPGAAQALMEALDRAASLGDLTSVPSLLADTAVVAERTGKSEASARLFGAAEAHRAAVGAIVTLPGRPIYESSIGTLRTLLGESDFAAAWTMGEQLPGMFAVDEARAVLSSAMDAHPPDAIRRLGLARGNELTPREQQVLRLLMAGHSDRQIAEALFISPHTVSSHMTHILEKLGVPSRTAAVAYAHRHGFS